jgi:hypothetical protein
VHRRIRRGRVHLLPLPQPIHRHPLHQVARHAEGPRVDVRSGGSGAAIDRIGTGAHLWKHLTSKGTPTEGGIAR